MSSGLVRSAISSVLDDECFRIEAPRVLNAKLLARELLNKAVENDTMIGRFDSFAERLVMVLKEASKEDKRLKLQSTKRKRMWSSFHQARVDTLPSLWASLLHSFGVNNDDTALLTEHVNQKIHESCILSSIPAVDANPQFPPLTADEANALRYCAGYIPFALKKKMDKRPEFKICLERMAVSGIDSSFLDYTKVWTKAINRGGLFEVNDKVYHFFLDLEAKIRHNHLPKLLAATSTEFTKKDILQDIIDDEDVLFSWMLATSDFDDEALSSELLHSVVELFLTIRGHSAAGAWMEYYKQYYDRKTKKEHSLRKGLKRKRMEALTSEGMTEQETAEP